MIYLVKINNVHYAVESHNLYIDLHNFGPLRIFDSFNGIQLDKIVSEELPDHPLNDFKGIRTEIEKYILDLENKKHAKK